MLKSDVDACINEASKLIDRLVEVKEQADSFSEERYAGGHFTSAAKRQSMEVTRALSELRDPWRTRVRR